MPTWSSTRSTPRPRLRHRDTVTTRGGIEARRTRCRADQILVINGNHNVECVRVRGSISGLCTDMRRVFERPCLICFASASASDCERGFPKSEGEGLEMGSCLEFSVCTYFPS